MPVPVSNRVNSSTGNGVTTTFPYTFKILDEDELLVEVDGVTQSGNYTVTGVGEDLGGNVVFDTAPANGTEVVRSSNTPYNRETDYQRNGSFLEATVDADYDRATIQIQQLAAALKRAIKLPKTVTDDQVIPENAEDRALATIGFDADGDLTLYDPASAVTASENVAFEQSGTGATARDLQAKSREILSVTDFFANGASGSAVDPTGSLDNTLGFAAAVAALPATGGVIVMPPGTYKGSFAITGTKRIRIIAYGAVLAPTNGSVGINVNQGNSSTVPGVAIEGLRIDGSAGSVTGIRFRDTNNSSLTQVEIRDCAVAVSLESHAVNGFCEGSLLENVLLRQNTIGVDFVLTSGTGSFAQTIIRGLRCVVGSGGVGLRVPQSCILQRSWVQALFFVGDGETAVSVDGNMEDANWFIAIEGAAGSTTNVGLSIGANLTNGMQWSLQLQLTGLLNTEISNTSNIAFNYSPGGAKLVQTTGSAFWGYSRFGDTVDRIALQILNAGATLEFGSGSATRDVIIARDGAGVSAQRNGANAQGYRLYNTFTSASVYERLNVAWTSNVAEVMTDQLGGGTSRALRLGTKGAASLNFAVNDTNVWTISGADSALVCNTDNATDIGRTNSVRPRHAHLAGYIAVGDGITAPGAGTGEARIYVDTADGDLKVVFADGTVKVLAADT